LNNRETEGDVQDDKIAKVEKELILLTNKEINEQTLKNNYKYD